MHNGIAAVIDFITDSPIDFEEFSNFTLKCKIASDKPHSEELEKWQAKHGPKCPKNLDGSSNSMEKECAMRLWNRSVKDHEFRYTTMLSDSDSKAFDSLVDPNIKRGLHKPCVEKNGNCLKKFDFGIKRAKKSFHWQREANCCQTDKDSKLLWACYKRLGQ